MNKFIDLKINNGKFNMSYDTFLLEEHIKNNEKSVILRLYGWNPACVSLGRNQKETDINFDFCNQKNIDIVRRITGGRAIFHNKEITYSFICSKEFLQNKDSIIFSYKEISEALILGFKKTDIKIGFAENKNKKPDKKYCMSLSTGVDLSYNDKKIIGSAQVRKNNYILQHGSILIDIDFDLISNIFNEKIDKNKITFLNKINPHISERVLCGFIKEGFEDKFNIKFIEGK